MADVEIHVVLTVMLLGSYVFMDQQTCICLMLLKVCGKLKHCIYSCKPMLTTTVRVII